MYNISSKLAIEAPERHFCCCSGAFIVNFEQITLTVLVFPLLILHEYMLTELVKNGYQSTHQTTFMV